MYNFNLRLQETDCPGKRRRGLFVSLIALVVMMQNTVQAQNWTSRTSAGDNTWNDIVYSSEKNLFVAVARAGTNRVMTSPDGITWTARTEPTTSNWSSVTYASWSRSVNNKSLTGNVATLTTTAVHHYSVGMAVTVTGVDATFNGTYTITATTSTTFSYARTAANVSSAAVSPVGTASAGWFVAVGETSTQAAMTSPDGITWTARTTPNGSYNGIAYGNGVFVASNTNTGPQNGDNLHQSRTSPDGVNWTRVSSPAYNSWRGLTFGNGIFVAVGVEGVGNRVMTSSD